MKKYIIIFILFNIALIWLSYVFYALNNNKTYPVNKMVNMHINSMIEMMSWSINKEKELPKQSNIELLKAKKVEVVELSDWDIYTMEVTRVIKEVWNREVEMLAYNWSIPWPIIKVRKNSEITLKFINKVEDLETTLHSHWLRLDNDFDWVPKEMMWKQDAIGFWKIFEYKLKFPDEWIYWYHPHVREDLQQELWLYWNYIVEPENKDYWSKVNREETLILDDILLENDKIAAFSDSFTNYVLMWRYGNTMMINWDTNYDLKVKKWEVIRMYLTNVSNTRVYQLNIPWVKMKLVWWDIWKYEKEEYIDNFIIAPAERYIVELYFENSGSFDILNKNPEFTKVLWKITVSENEIENIYKENFNILRINNDIISDIDNFRKYFNTEPDKFLNLSVWMKGMKGRMWWMMNMWNSDKEHELIEWSDSMNRMNKMSNSNMMEWKLIDEETRNENMDIKWEFKVWDKVKIRIYNDPNSEHPMQHPIHFHGQRFLVVSNNGNIPNNMVWKDTALVRTWEYIDILLDVTNPGEWMSHCHIAEHLSAWMMMNFTVEK